MPLNIIYQKIMKHNRLFCIININDEIINIDKAIIDIILLELKLIFNIII